MYEAEDRSAASDTPIGPALARLDAMIAEQSRAAAGVPEDSATGPRGQHLTISECCAKALELASAIEVAEARGDLRHRTVGAGVKIVTLVFLVLVDYPVMLWLTGSVFNVDWNHPIGVPLLISAALSVLATGGVAWTLHQLGRNRRENKDHRGHLRWRGMSFGAVCGLLGAGVLVVLVATLMFERVLTEGEESGTGGLTVLLAAVIAAVMLLSAALVFTAALRDGSPQQDDLAYYGAVVDQGRRRQRAHEERVVQLLHERRALVTAWACATGTTSADHTAVQGTTVIAVAEHSTTLDRADRLLRGRDPVGPPPNEPGG